MSAQLLSAVTADRGDGDLAGTLGAARASDAAEIELVKKAQEGDVKAFDALVLKYQRRVISAALRYTHNWSDAQDVAQVTFFRAYRAIRTFRGESTFYTWLYRITANSSKSILAQRARDPVVLSLDMLNEEENSELVVNLREKDTPEELVGTDQLGHVVVSAMQQLSPEFREALELREIDGLSYQEIALATNSPVGTVRSRISRARDLIDKALRGTVDCGLGRRNGLAHASPCIRRRA